MLDRLCQPADGAPGVREPGARAGLHPADGRQRLQGHAEKPLAEADLRPGRGAGGPRAGGGSIKPDHGVTVCDKGEVFDEIIPLEELESISVGGIVYPLNAA